MRAFVYILGASNNPDEIKCKVPFEIDDKEIFFGPCKKRLRQKLKREIDTKGKLKTETFFVGLNANNVKRARKIMWAGKIQSHYSFQKANEKLIGNKYLSIKTDEKTGEFPLHVIPIKNGYQLKSDLHAENGDWILDIVSDRRMVNHDKKASHFTIKNGYSFDRDICFIFSNIFFAKGNGIDIDNEVLDIFQKHLKTNDIDAYTLLGKDKNGKPNGMRGGWLELDSRLTKSLIKLIEKKAEKIKKDSSSSQTKTNNKRNKNHQRGC